VRLSVGLLYYAMLGRDCCLLRDTVNIKAALPTSAIVLGQLGLSFWPAKLIVLRRSC
jgi:hypothetical protein